MVGECRQSRLVRLRFIMNTQRIVFGCRIGDPKIQVAGIAFFSVFGAIVQRDLERTLCRHVPYLRIETLQSSMQTVGTVIDREFINFQLPIFIFQLKDSVFDTVGYTPADSVEIRLFCLPFFCGLKSQHNVFDFPVAVGYEQFGDLCAEIGNLHFQSSTALDGIKLNCFHPFTFHLSPFTFHSSLITPSPISAT